MLGAQECFSRGFDVGFVSLQALLRKSAAKALIQLALHSFWQGLTKVVYSSR